MSGSRRPNSFWAIPLALFLIVGVIALNPVVAVGSALGWMLGGFWSALLTFELVPASKQDRRIYALLTWTFVAGTGFGAAAGGKLGQWSSTHLGLHWGWPLAPASFLGHNIGSIAGFIVGAIASIRMMQSSESRASPRPAFSTAPPAGAMRFPPGSSRAALDAVRKELVRREQAEPEGSRNPELRDQLEVLERAQSVLEDDWSTQKRERSKRSADGIDGLKGWLCCSALVFLVLAYALAWITTKYNHVLFIVSLMLACASLLSPRPMNFGEHRYRELRDRCAAAWQMIQLSIAVAIYDCWRIYQPRPLIDRIASSYRTLEGTWGAWGGHSIAMVITKDMLLVLGAVVGLVCLALLSHAVDWAFLSLPNRIYAMFHRRRGLFYR